MDGIDNSRRYKIEVCGFDLKIIMESLKCERYKRLSKTPWENRNPNGYPPDYGYDRNAKPVRQVDSVINYIKKTNSRIMKELSIEEKAKAYDEALKVAVAAHKDEDKHLKATLERIFPELKESEDDRIRKKLIECFTNYKQTGGYGFYGIETNNLIAWLEKQGKSKKYIFKSIPRLLDMIEPTERAKAYTKKLINTLTEEGYITDAKIVEECLKQMNGEHVAMAVMDEKRGEQKLANSYCQEHCKGFQETGKCFADGDCKAKTIAETVHAGTENILNELASRIEKAEIVNVRQVLEWIKEQTKE